MIRDGLGNRMKEYYEKRTKTKLTRRMPVIIRIDGKAFHTFTRGFKNPFDEILIKSMQETTKYLCENIQGCVLGYTQSDEISLVLVDYQKLTSDAWFDYEIQKLCSVAASMATMTFNKDFNERIYLLDDDCNDDGTFNIPIHQAHITACNKGAMFDARVFNIPKEEVTNYIYWRQLDATRNSIQMVGQANFSHKELHGKSCDNIQDMLMTQKGINWNDYPIYQKRGSCCIKEEYHYIHIEENGFANEFDEKCIGKRSRWIIDKEIPIFKGECREYIDKLVFI